MVEAWLDDPDEPGSWQADYDVLAIDGDVFVEITLTDAERAELKKSAEAVRSTQAVVDAA